MKISKKTKVISVVVVIMNILIFIGACWWFKSLNKESLATSSNLEPLSLEKKNLNIDVNTIIDNNIGQKKREELKQEEIDLEYTTTYEENSSLPKGTLQVLQEGMDGKQIVMIKKTYQGDNLISEEECGSTVTRAAINKIVQVGTGSGKKNVKILKGEKLYVTSYTVNVMQSPDKSSDKVTTLEKGTEVIFIEKKNGWYKIQKDLFEGWIDGDCVTSENPEEENLNIQEGNEEQIRAKLSMDMNLAQPSGLSLAQFKKVLSSCSEDTNKVFKNNAEYFYYIEQEYKINGIFVAAVGIHESNWGKSAIAKEKYNLFGYGAKDSSPYKSAYKFKNYAEGIDMIARVLVKYYINPPGAQIYSGTASGKYYNGRTLKGVNKKYATDKNWCNAVYKQMEKLYGKL